MFISRTHYEQLVANLAAARDVQAAAQARAVAAEATAVWLREHAAKLEDLVAAVQADAPLRRDLERRIAAQSATIDWFTTHVNRLETERAILTQERLRVLYPTPTIERIAPELSTRPAGIEGAPHIAPDESVVAEGLPLDSIALAQAVGGMLEDMGDEAAARAGIKHDRDGNVLYK